MHCNEMTVCLFVLFVLLVVSVAAITIVVIKQRTKITELQESYDLLETIIGNIMSNRPSATADDVAANNTEEDEKEVTPDNTTTENPEDDEIKATPDEDNSDAELNEAVKTELDAIIKRIQESPGVSERLMNSPTYGKLKKLIESKTIIPYNHELWNEIDKLVEDVFPNFRRRMVFLYGRKIKEPEMRVIMLMKFGFTPAQTARIINMPRSNMNYYKEKFGKNSPIAVLLKDYDLQQIIYNI